LLVGDILYTTAKRCPEKVGIVYESNEYTWQEVNARVNSMATGLLNLGLKKGDRVAILCRNCNQYLEFYFACAKTGLVALPFNTWYKVNELSQLLNLSKPDAIIVDEMYYETMSKVPSGEIKHYISYGNHQCYSLDLETLIRENPSSEPVVQISEDDLFALSFTSGTTGTPKVAMITHRNVNAAVWRMALELRIKSDSVYLLHAPMFFAAGGGGRLPCILKGCRVIITSYETQRMLQIIEKERVTHFTGSPTPIKRLVEHPDVTRYDLSSVQVIGLTGGIHTEAEITEIERVFGHVWYACWGMTETCACGSIMTPEEVRLEGHLSSRIGSIGKAQVGLELTAVNENGYEIKHDGKEIGELICRGDIVMKGYWNSPEETSIALHDGWLRTGDIVVIDRDGYIYIVDRKKDIIISGGINIVPRELEEIILTHEAVSQCAVIGVPDEQWGETPKAIVVLRPGKHVTQEEIIGLCVKNLASFKKPSLVVFIDSLPTTTSGKISKTELREHYC
jgi:acyl-CoA synthetase (AMP-forming)/AMP-acid ligase II